MRTFLIILVFGFFTFKGKTQNCNAFKYYGDTLQYKACEFSAEADKYYQFSKEYQEIYDKSIEICPYFSTAYHAKSVAYLKSGDFITWKRLIDRAVELKPTEYLGYRGWCRYQFIHDYEGAIKDIERLDSLVNHDIGFSSNGDYHLNIAKGICYKAIGKIDEAINVIEQQLEDEEHMIGKYDNLHLGVLYLEKGNYVEAINKFNLQEKEYDIAENNYYKAIAYKNLGNWKKVKEYLTKSKEFYMQDKKMFDPYTSPIDKIYLNQIEEELKTAANNG